MENRSIFEDVPGIGSKTARVLEQAGYNSIRDVAATSSGELAGRTGFYEYATNAIIVAARQYLLEYTLNISSITAKILVKAGYDSVQALETASISEIKSITNLSDLDAQRILNEARKIIEVARNDAKNKKQEQQIQLEDIPGVGCTTAEILYRAGYGSVEAIAVSSASEIANTANISVFIAQKIINEARNLADVGGFKVVDGELEPRKVIGKITFIAKALDKLMGGGVETQAITELYGKFGSGRTQICHQMAVNVQLPLEQGGLAGSVIIIDTNNTFSPERIVQMVNAISTEYGVKYDPEEFLKNIHVAKAHNSNQQILLVNNVTELAGELKNTEKPVRLLIIDSLTSHFMSDYIGRGNLANRQQKLNKHLHDLNKFSKLFNAAVLVTNEVIYKPDAFHGNPIKPVGGHIVGHTANFRVYLRRFNKSSDKHVARIVDSPNLPEGEAIFKITPDGIKD